MSISKRSEALVTGWDKVKGIIQTFTPMVAVLAFFALLATFAWTLFDFRSDIEYWARRDVRLRAQLAADSLRIPLATQDIRRIGEIGQELKNEHGLWLSIYSPQGGVFYREAVLAADDVSEVALSGEYKVELGRPKADVFMPFYEAIVGFVLAVLVGVFGMFALFFVLYRQRVKIRELAKLEKFRREFIADVSHEIKTPLTGIIGAVDLMETVNGEEGIKQRQILFPLLKKEVKRLNGLVQSILDLARLEREGEVLNLVDTDLSAIVLELSNQYGARANVPPNCVVRCDGQLVSQALTNLIVNAIRHSGTKDIAVWIEVATCEVRIVVEDHGVGIPPEHVAQIFERFHRVDPARSAETGGAGLGLAIARRIARLHGGEVAFLPAQPQGCKFVFSLTVR